MAARFLATLFVLASFWSLSARAAPVTISGSGQFGPNEALSSVYRPNSLFEFKFMVDSPLADNPTDLVGAYYMVGGNAVSTPIVVQFFTDDDGGLFALGFDDGASLSFFGANIGSSGMVITGTFIGEVDGSAQDYGSATIIAAYAVPLPPSLALLGMGLLLFAGAGSLRK